MGAASGAQPPVPLSSHPSCSVQSREPPGVMTTKHSACLRRLGSSTPSHSTSARRPCWPRAHRSQAEGGELQVWLRWVSGQAPAPQPSLAQAWLPELSTWGVRGPTRPTLHPRTTGGPEGRCGPGAGEPARPCLSSRRCVRTPWLLGQSFPDTRVPLVLTTLTTARCLIHPE